MLCIKEHIETTEIFNERIKNDHYTQALDYVVICVSYRFCLFLIKKSLLALGGRHRDWLDVGFTDWLDAILTLFTPFASTLGGATYLRWAIFLLEPPGVVLLV